MQTVTSSSASGSLRGPPARWRCAGRENCRPAAAARGGHTALARATRRDGGKDVNDPNLREHSRDLPIGLSHAMEAWYHPIHCMNDPQPEGHMASHIV